MKVIRHFVFSYGWCSVLLKSEADVGLHTEEAGFQDPFNFPVLFGGLLSFIYWKTWQCMKGLQSLVMQEKHHCIDTVHEVDGNWLNTLSHCMRAWKLMG